MPAIAIEYEVETIEGELVNCFTWSELVKWFSDRHISASALKMASRRGTILLGQYRLAKVSYERD